jgi:hypothetical protein
MANANSSHAHAAPQLNESTLAEPNGIKVANNERILISLVQDGCWRINDKGEVWRIAIKQKTIYGINSKRRIVAITPRRAERGNCNGYLTVQASINRKVIPCLAHRLVWQFLHGDIPQGMYINHMNGIRNDNRPCNLELVTQSRNARHSFWIGNQNNSGEKHPEAKLTNQQAEEIRRRWKKKGDGLRLAKEYGVTPSVISRIKSGKGYFPFSSINPERGA